MAKKHERNIVKIIRELRGNSQMVKKMCNGARVSLRIMQITRWRTVVSLGSVLLVLGTSLDAQAVPAFPGCEGLLRIVIFRKTVN